MTHPPDLPFRDGVTTWSLAREAGLSSEAFRSLVRSGLLWRPARGVVGQGAPPHHAEDRHRVAARGMAWRLDACVAHESALLLRGLPWWGVPGPVRLGRVGERCVRPRSGAVVHPVRGTVEEVRPPGCLAAWPMTSLAESLAEVALRSDVGVEAALVPWDAALHAGLVTVAEVVDSAGVAWPGGTGAVRRRGAAALRQVARLADGRSESPGETRTRLALLRAGLYPTPQVWIPTDRGRKRVDLALEDVGVAVEFDGREKYDGVEGRDALVREKEREDALRAAGWGVVRVLWKDLAPAGLPGLLTRIEDEARRVRGRRRR